MALEYMRQFGPQTVYDQMETMRRIGTLNLPTTANMGDIVAQGARNYDAGRSAASLEGVASLMGQNAPSNQIEAALARGGNLSEALRLRESRMNAGKPKSESDRFKMVSRLNSLGYQRSRLLDTGYSDTSKEVVDINREMELIKNEIAASDPNFQRAYQSFMGSESTAVQDPQMTAEYEQIKSSIDAATDTKNRGTLDNYDALIALVAEFRRKYPGYKNFADELDQTIQAKQDQASRNKEAKVGAERRGRERIMAGQEYANKVLEQFRKNKSAQLDGLNGVSNVLAAISGNMKSALNKYNTVKAALRATVPEAVNQDDVANIKAIDQGGVLATFLGKIGARSPLGEEEVEAAVRSLVDVYNKNFQTIDSAISETITDEDPKYRGDVKKALKGLLRGLKPSYSYSSVVGSKGVESPAKPDASGVRFLR